MSVASSHTAGPGDDLVLGMARVFPLPFLFASVGRTGRKERRTGDEREDEKKMRYNRKEETGDGCGKIRRGENSAKE